jgi:hypothetical protein
LTIFWKKRLEKFDDLMKNPDEPNRKFAYQLLEEHFGFFIDKIRESCKVRDKQFDLAKMQSNWKTLRNKFQDIIPHSELQPWDKFFNRRTGFPKYRNELVHKTNYTPPSVKELEYWRGKAVPFVGFIISANKEYKQQVFTLTETIENYLYRLLRMIESYSTDTKMIKDPYFFKDTVTKEELPNLMQRVQNTIRANKDIREQKPTELREIIILIDVVGRLEGREYTFLENDICPLCGNMIEETQDAYGGSMDDPQPTTIYYRVGCSKCDFLLHDESINI